jgi:hypothetical protein
MTPLNSKMGGTAGKGQGEIVACRASWRVVSCDGLMAGAQNPAKVVRPLPGDHGRLTEESRYGKELDIDGEGMSVTVTRRRPGVSFGARRGSVTRWPVR